jgi:hypothetical protein
VPIEHHLNDPLIGQDPLVSAIENEIPAYRAISPLAVFSLIFGILSILSFTGWFFLGFAVLAIGLGVMAERKIQRMPDVLTGRGLAQAGIGLGLVFGLMAFTTSTVQGVLRANQAKQFALRYEDTFKKGTVNELLWLGQPPSTRKLMGPDEYIKKRTENSKDEMMFDQETGTVRGLKKKLQEAGADFHFDRVEQHGDDGMNMFASALFDVHLPNSTDPAEREGHALAFMKAMKFEGKYDWWVEEFRYPYQPQSYVPAAKPVDDGHGHAH